MNRQKDDNEIAVPSLHISFEVSMPQRRLSWHPNFQSSRSKSEKAKALR